LGRARRSLVHGTDSPEEVARREFMEELGSAPAEPLSSLGEIRQRGGKRVHAFAVEGDIDVATIASNTKHFGAAEGYAVPVSDADDQTLVAFKRHTFLRSALLTGCQYLHRRPASDDEPT
jgi:8-oxo-dGTP pyrophosphatase MutT (NUDIX family)